MIENMDGWSEYKRLVIAELERLNDCAKANATEIARLRGELQHEAALIRTETLRGAADAKTDSDDELGALKTELAVIKVKAGLWGALAGAVPGVISLIAWLVSTYSH